MAFKQVFHIIERDRTYTFLSEIDRQAFLSGLPEVPVCVLSHSFVLEKEFEIVEGFLKSSNSSAPLAPILYGPDLERTKQKIIMNIGPGEDIAFIQISLSRAKALNLLRWLHRDVGYISYSHSEGQSAIEFHQLLLSMVKPSAEELEPRKRSSDERV